MVIHELLDIIYDTINIKIDPKGGATATFRTEIDNYTVQIQKPSPHHLVYGGFSIPVQLSTITFSSKNLSMGHASAEHAQYTTYVYPTVVKCIEMYVKHMERSKKPCIGFCCSVAGDNERGSKRKIYQALFTMSTKFGFHKWGKELACIRLDIYEKLKKNGFQTPEGNLITDDSI